MSSPGFVLVAALLLASTLAYGSSHEFEAEFRSSPRAKGPGGFGMPGGGFGIPGWSGGNGIPGFPGGGGSGWGNMGGGWGAGFGGPRGGYAKGGIVRPSMVCTERGPCYKKRLTCPSKCFTSYTSSGKNYGAGGGGGGCTIDCKKKCVAYC